MELGEEKGLKEEKGEDHKEIKKNEISQDEPYWKIHSWNVNGIRALVKKLEADGENLEGFFRRHKADIVCFQETKITADQKKDLDGLAHVPGYESFWSFSKVKSGYSGVVTFCKKGYTLDAVDGMGVPDYDQEGRLIMTDHGDFILFNVYFPNGARAGRYNYKLQFYEAFRKKCESLLLEGRHIIVVGDVNTAHQEIDISSQKAIQKPTTGYLPEERAWMDRFLNESGFVDSFRSFHPEEPDHYTWWDPKTNKRAYNKGWRLDYTLVSKEYFESNVLEAGINKEQYGSDHCPVYLKVKPIEMPPDHIPPALSSANMKRPAKQPSLLAFFSAKPAKSEDLKKRAAEEESERQVKKRKEEEEDISDISDQD